MEKLRDASGSQPQFYSVPPASPASGDSEKSMQKGRAVVHRPSIETGSRYKQVSAAYVAAVHSVLTGQRKAPEAAAELEKQLIQITGFPLGPPQTWR